MLAIRVFSYNFNANLDNKSRALYYERTKIIFKWLSSVVS